MRGQWYRKTNCDHRRPLAVSLPSLQAQAVRFTRRLHARQALEAPFWTTIAPHAGKGQGGQDAQAQVSSGRDSPRPVWARTRVIVHTPSPRRAAVRTHPLRRSPSFRIVRRRCGVGTSVRAWPWRARSRASRFGLAGPAPARGRRAGLVRVVAGANFEVYMAGCPVAVGFPRAEAALDGRGYRANTWGTEFRRCLFGCVAARGTPCAAC